MPLPTMLPLARQSTTARSPRGEEALGASANGDTAARDVRAHRGFARGTAWDHLVPNAPTCREEVTAPMKQRETERQRAVQQNDGAVRRTACLRRDRLLPGPVATCALLLGLHLGVGAASARCRSFPLAPVFVASGVWPLARAEGRGGPVAVLLLVRAGMLILVRQLRHSEDVPVAGLLIAAVVWLVVVDTGDVLL